MCSASPTIHPPSHSDETSICCQRAGCQLHDTKSNCWSPLGVNLRRRWGPAAQTASPHSTCVESVRTGVLLSIIFVILVEVPG
jgi:hypothetical protein